MFSYIQTAFTGVDTALNCVCNSGNYGDYIDVFHGHVLIGDLNMISNKNIFYEFWYEI